MANIKTLKEHAFENMAEVLDRHTRFLRNADKHYEPLQKAFIEAGLIKVDNDGYDEGVIRMRPDGSYVHIGMTGTKDDLVKVLRIMAKHGFRIPKNNRPVAGETSYSAFIYHDDPNGEYDDAMVWFMFSSTTCKRVQIGTETKEMPIYAMKCGDGEEELDLGAAVAEADDVTSA